VLRKLGTMRGLVEPDRCVSEPEALSLPPQFAPLPLTKPQSPPQRPGPGTRPKTPERSFPLAPNANDYTRGPSAKNTDGRRRHTPTSRGPCLHHARDGGQGRTMDCQDY
jgi:hypothetical protein